MRRSGAWHYAGHAGAGFNAASLKEIHARLSRLIRSRKPFKQRIAGEDTTIWVRPKLVCEVRFTEWTERGQMRHPVFVGLRTDKPAKDVMHERTLKAAKRAPARRS